MTKDILVGARKRIEKPENWCRGQYGLDKDGNPCVWHDAVRLCAIGALMYEANTRGVSAIPAERALFAAFGGTEEVSYWNDICTHEFVLAMFDKAIAACT